MLQNLGFNAPPSETHPEAQPPSDPTATPGAMGPAPYAADTHPARQPLYHVHDAVQVLHYGAVAKPWAKHIGGLKDMQIEFHPVLYEQFKHWRESAQKMCPDVKRLRKNRQEGEDEWETWHPVGNV
jgi:hypothetical protein